MTPMQQAKTQTWNFNVPPDNLRNTSLRLLTISGLHTTARWCGQLGEHYVAWAPVVIQTSNPSANGYSWIKNAFSGQLS